MAMGMIIDIILVIVAIVLFIRNREWDKRIWWRIQGKEKRSFRQVIKAIDNLAEEIRRQKQNFEPNFIIGIDGGGYLVAAMLAGRLKKGMRTLEMNRDENGKTIEVNEDSLGRLGDVSDKTILVVDDDSSGRTLSLVEGVLAKRGANSVRLAVLSRRTDEQLDSRRGDYPLSSSDYQFAVWRTREPVEYPWEMFWIPLKRG